MVLQDKSFENTVGKGEIAHDKQLFVFPECFLLTWRTFLPFSSNSKLSEIFSVWKSLKFVIWERVNMKFRSICFNFFFFLFYSHFLLYLILLTEQMCYGEPGQRAVKHCVVDELRSKLDDDCRYEFNALL